MDSRIQALRHVYEDLLVRMMRIRLEENDPEAEDVKAKVKILGKFLEFLDSGEPNETVRRVPSDSLLVFTVPEVTNLDLNKIFKEIETTLPPTSKIIVMSGPLALHDFTKEKLLEGLPAPEIWRPESFTKFSVCVREYLQQPVPKSFQNAMIPNKNTAQERANRIIDKMRRGGP